MRSPYTDPSFNIYPYPGMFNTIAGVIGNSAERINAAAAQNAALFPIVQTALSQYANSFAVALETGAISPECGKDISALKITADAWAGALVGVNILYGPTSSVNLAQTMRTDDPSYRRAVSANYTVGGQFTSGTTRAWSSALDNRVWINPGMVNPGSAANDSGLIAHETLHNLGLLDPVIQDALGLTVGSDTSNITTKLEKDCFSGLSNGGIVMP
jgi:hypothetical protein